MRYSNRLKNAIIDLRRSISPDELRELLVCIHIHSTATAICSRLFNIDEQIIIDTLKEENVYEYKVCCICDRLHHYSEYYSDKAATGGVSPICPNCHRIKRGIYRNDHREEHNISRREDYWKNREHILARTAEARKKPEFQIWLKNWTQDYIKKPEVIERRRNRDRLRNRTDQKHRVNKHFRENMRSSLLNGKEGNSWETLVGYTINDLMEHLESQFKENMNWDNYGVYWVIDHIVPIAKFQYRSFRDPHFKLCWSLINLQPLEAGLNLQKHDIISESWGNVELAKAFGVIN